MGKVYKHMIFSQLVLFPDEDDGDVDTINPDISAVTETTQQASQHNIT